MSIDIQGLTVEKIIVHHVFKRNEERQPVPPKFGTELVTLPPAAMTAFQKRITQALGHRSSGLEMSIEDDSPDSFFQIGAAAISADTGSYISTTAELATSLARIQAAKDLNASKLIFITGRAGAASTPYKAVIKAELQDGFSESGSKVQYLDDLFLTPTQKLYKIGFIHNIVTGPPSATGQYDPAGYKAYLFDHLLNLNETRSAAHYFYSRFLGMEILASDKRLTREFFENTQTFINTLEIDQNSKVELFESLRSELRSNRATLQTASFAEAYLDESNRGKYLDFMNQKGVPANSFSKSLEYITSRLRLRQKMSFRGGVTISAPSDQLHQLVTVEETTADHTLIKINGAIENQE